MYVMQRFVLLMHSSTAVAYTCASYTPACGEEHSAAGGVRETISAAFAGDMCSGKHGCVCEAAACVIMHSSIPVAYTCVINVCVRRKDLCSGGMVVCARQQFVCSCTAPLHLQSW